MSSNEKKQLAKVFTVLPLVIAILGLVLAGLVYTRADFTENRAFTVSEITRKTIDELPNPVSVTYYLTPRLEREIPEIQGVTDILREMERINPSRFSLDIVDPDTNPSVSPEDLGIQPQQYRVVEENQQSVALVYAGLVINYQDQFAVLPLVANSATVEYEVVQNIRELTEDRKRVLGVVFGQTGLEQSHQYLLGQFGDFAEIRQIPVNEEIPGDVEVLLVIGHADITQDGAFLLDQYLMQGKPVLAALDYHSVDLSAGLQAVPGAMTPLLESLTTYGFGLEDSWILDPQNQPIPVQQAQGRVVFQTLQDYPLWPRIGSSGVDPEHPLTSRFAGLDLFWASPVAYSGQNPDGVRYPLRSTPAATAMSPPVNPDPRALPPGNPSDGTGFPLMLTYEGDLSSAFVGNLPQSYQDWTLQEQSLSPVRFGLIGDQDVFSDLIQIHQASYNLEFVKSAYEWLAGDEAMMGIRTRQLRNTSLDAIQDPDEKASRASAARILGIAIGPLVFAAIGLLRFLRRRRRTSPPTATVQQQGGSQ